MLLDENYWAIPPDLETYALEHPMIPLGEAARDADHLAALKTRPPKRQARARKSDRPVRATAVTSTPPSNAVTRGWTVFIHICILVAGSATVRAERFLYSFSGQVAWIERDELGLLAANNFRTGALVSASYIIDLATPGYRIYNDG